MSAEPVASASPAATRRSAGERRDQLVEAAVVVVGGGMATVHLCERHAPYNRILLSAVLEGTHSADALTLRSAAWFEEHGRVERIIAAAGRQWQHRGEIVADRALAEGGQS